MKFPRLSGWAPRFLPAAVLVLGARAAAEAPALPPVMLPEVEVRAQPFFDGFEKINHAFDGAFPSLNSGELVEAVLWRHRYLAAHPQEQAIIVIDLSGNRVKAATTVYTEGGKVYGSSNMLGEHLPIPKLLPAALRQPAGIAQARHYLDGRMGALSNSFADKSPDRGKYADPGAGPPTLGGAIAAGQASGDYRNLGSLAGGPAAMTDAGDAAAAVPGANPAAGPGDMSPGDAARMMKDQQLLGFMSQERRDSAQALAEGLVMPFEQPTGETLAWTYSMMRDPTKAGLIPVALTAVAVGRGKPVPTLVFDWEGTQYYYRPGLGAVALPLPMNPLIGQPFLCVKNGEFLESVYFCALYARQHPEAPPPVLLVDHPSLVGYADGDKLGLFVPEVGSFTLPAEFRKALGDDESLAQVRDELISQIRGGPQAGALPEQLPGDTAELQIRRAYLAFQAAGISSQLTPGGHPVLQFGWQGVKFSYGEDQKVQ
ncbi:MAG TPA: hypothetical protein VHV47_11870, partial [Opitutaceae bacterium]|nr:hypothetical protein [Opitutaceae bacterium]